MKRYNIPIILSFVLLFSACQEESFTKAIITVYDNEGNTVPGVIVKLSQEDLGPNVSQTDITSFQTSDEQGQTEHVLDREAIMNVDAVLQSEADTLLYGQTKIRLVRGQTIQKDIEITTY